MMKALSPLTLTAAIVLLSGTNRWVSADYHASSDHHHSKPTKVIELNDSNFEHATQAATGGTTGDWFIKFYAPWCGHCKSLAPVWENVAGMLGGEVNVAALDCIQNRLTAGRFGIKGYPSLVFIKDQKMYHFKGPRSAEGMAMFAKDGYRSVEPLPVPMPKSQLGIMLSQFSSAIMGMGNLVTENPLSSIMLFASGGFGGLVLGFVVAYASFSFPKAAEATQRDEWRRRNGGTVDPQPEDCRSSLRRSSASSRAKKDT